LALIGAVKGYPTIIALPEKMSREKVDVMKGLGATVIRTPTEAACSCPDSHYGVARRMNGEIENSVMLDQFANPHNPEAHYGETALEIWEACAGKVDMVVIGAGTGGSITGITRKLRELNPSIIVVGVDPFGSNLSGSTEHQAYLIEGIGCDFVPDVLDPGLVDLWIRTEDKESFLMARRMIRDEGILCGGSSGSAMAGLVKAMKHYDLGPDKRAVVLLPDSVRNYMSKFLNDDWMLIKDFISPQDIPNACQQSGHSDRMIATSLVCHEDSVAVEKSTTISSLSTTNAIVLGDEDHVCGILSVEKMAEKIGLCGEAAVLDMSVSKMVATDFGVVSEEMPLGHVLQFLQTDYPVILKTGSGGYRIVDKPKTIMKMLLTKSASCPEAMIERLSI
jgi:cystathionine beta-synthase